MRREDAALKSIAGLMFEVKIDSKDSLADWVANKIVPVFLPRNVSLSMTGKH